ncbi:hypothetical protein WJX79_010161 [Trebouxia sp. C0005]
MIFAVTTIQEHGCLHHAFGFPVKRAVWSLLSPGERDEEPPDEKEDFVLHFEDVDKLPARDLDTITAWMQSMLASFYQLCNVERRTALGPGRLLQDMVQDKLDVAECESSLGRRHGKSKPSGWPKTGTFNRRYLIRAD